MAVSNAMFFNSLTQTIVSNAGTENWSLVYLEGRGVCFENKPPKELLLGMNQGFRQENVVVNTMENKPQSFILLKWGSHNWYPNAGFASE